MRLIVRLILFAAVAVVLVVVGCFFFFDRAATSAVERGVSQALSVPTQVSSVSLRPFAGTLKLEGLRLANPEGFSSKPMLELGLADMDVTLGSLLADTIEVPKFELAGIHLRLEGQGMKTNYGTVLEHARRGGGKSEPDPKDPGSQAAGKRFIVRELVIRDTTIVADYTLHESLGKSAAAAAEVKIPEIRLKDVGNGKPLSVAELSIEIFRALLDAAASGDLPGISADFAKDLKHDLSELEGRAKDLGQEVEGTLQGVKDLFKKD